MAIAAAPTTQASPRLIAGLGLLVAVVMIAGVLVAQARAGTASDTGSYRLSDTTMLMQQVRAAAVAPAP
jgi:RPA family protein